MHITTLIGLKHTRKSHEFRFSENTQAIVQILHLSTFIDLVGGFKHVLFSISYIGCHPKPIDEVHHFSRWLSHHQPDI